MYPNLPMLRQAFLLRFGLERGRPSRWLSRDIMMQLLHCKDDESRRLLLGMSA